MTNLGSNPRRSSSPSYVPSWPSVCLRRGLQPRREIVSVSAIPVIVEVSVTETSDAVNVEMDKQTDGHRFVLSSESLPSAVWLVGW
jgi:hypothetical protein